MRLFVCFVKFAVCVVVLFFKSILHRREILPFFPNEYCCWTLFSLYIGLNGLDLRHTQ